MGQEDAKSLFDSLEKTSTGEVKMEDYLVAYKRRTAQFEAGGGSTVIIDENGEWMLNPRNQFRLTWDIAIIMPLLVYLTIMLPFRLAFANEPPLNSWVYWVEFLIDLFFIGEFV
jgi:hypothetical protein